MNVYNTHIVGVGVGMGVGVGGCDEHAPMHMDVGLCLGKLNYLHHLYLSQTCLDYI